MNAACGNEGFSQESIYAACELFSKYDFEKMTSVTFFRKMFLMKSLIFHHHDMIIISS
jgi:hypothetical protein